MALNLEHLHRVHCLGVGGIGVSAVAKFLRLRGKEVSGSDATRSEVTADAERAGVIVKNEDPENITVDLDLLVYTSAAPDSHPERLSAARLGIPQLRYSEFLGLLSRSYDTVAVCGTNGKSTTTALLGLMLEAGGLDPLVIVGSRVSSFPHGNLRNGRGTVFVVEACEYRAHFLDLSPKIAVVTNVAEDHLDYYRDLAHIRETFQRFIDTLPPGGLLVLNADDHVSRQELKPPVPFKTYGLHADADYSVEGLAVRDAEQRFTVVRREPPERWPDVRLRIPGDFNVSNALAAAAAARELGVSAEAIAGVLASFTGIWRRFERLGEFRGATVISDYGHHPDAVRETLRAARDFYPGRRIILAFQPHQHDRTRKLFDEFVASFDGADALLLPEIYGVTGRTQGIGDVSSRDLARAVVERDRLEGRKRRVEYAADLGETRTKIESAVRSGDVLIVMGAGDVYTVANGLVQ